MNPGTVYLVTHSGGHVGGKWQDFLIGLAVAIGIVVLIYAICTAVNWRKKP